MHAGLFQIVIILSHPCNCSTSKAKVRTSAGHYGLLVTVVLIECNTCCRVPRKQGSITGNGTITSKKCSL